MKEYTIIQDKQEKIPLLFPEHIVIANSKQKPDTAKLVIKEQSMKTADYYLEGYETVCRIERKGSLTEVSGRLLVRENRKGGLDQLDRLSKCCQVPVLLLEGSVTSLQRVGPHLPEPALAIDSLLYECIIRGIQLLLLPGGSIPLRRATGETAARFLIQAARASESNEWQTLIHRYPSISKAEPDLKPAPIQ